MITLSKITNRTENKNVTYNITTKTLNASNYQNVEIKLIKNKKYKEEK